MIKEEHISNSEFVKDYGMSCVSISENMTMW